MPVDGDLLTGKAASCDAEQRLWDVRFESRVHSPSTTSLAAANLAKYGPRNATQGRGGGGDVRGGQKTWEEKQKTGQPQQTDSQKTGEVTGLEEKAAASYTTRKILLESQCSF
jgi:hypothetical protein